MNETLRDLRAIADEAKRAETDAAFAVACRYLDGNEPDAKDIANFRTAYNAARAAHAAWKTEYERVYGPIGGNR